jgi:anti-anti-sigma factor
LTDAPFIDSTTLKAIVAASNRFEEEGRALLVVSGNGTVARVLEVTGLECAIEIRPTLSGAISDALDGVLQMDGKSAR